MKCNCKLLHLHKKTKTIVDMRPKQNFNKSEIFKTAWRCYRKHRNEMTFGQCLKWSWKKAWENLRKTNLGAYAIAFTHKNAGFWKKFDERNRRRYANVTFGRNDWAATYARY